jgi:iron complex transport system permease protein
MLQTLFRNPLAGPFIIGIAPGATFFIGIFLLLLPNSLPAGFLSNVGLPIIGILGGSLVLLLQLWISRRLPGIFGLLLIGVMIGYLLNAGTEIMQTLATAEQIRSFVHWGFGNFDRVELDQLPWFGGAVFVSLVFTFFWRYRMDAYLPGDALAQNAGLNVRSFRLWMIIFSALLAGVSTAFCGPIGFVGLAAPHLARIITGSNSHRIILLPALILGAIFCVCADLLAHHLFRDITLNANSVCAIIGAPVVLYVLMRYRGTA